MARQSLVFPALSEPMVSVRATVMHALAEAILTDAAASRVLSAAKALHYRDRSWDKIMQRLQGEPEMAGLFAWLPGGQVDAKRDDACEMLRQMASFLNGADAGDRPPAQRVERTLGWQGLVRRIEAEGGTFAPGAKAVLDELRLDPDRYSAMRDRAALRALALDAAGRRGAHPDRDALLSLMARHRRDQNLSRRDEVMRWLDENDLDEDGYEALLSAVTLVEETIATRPGGLDRHILAELQWSGEYPALKTRAEAKARVTGVNGSAAASPERLRMLIWFFEDRLDRQVPDDPDAYAASIGLAGRDELFDLIGREFHLSFQRGRSKRTPEKPASPGDGDRVGRNGGSDALSRLHGRGRAPGNAISSVSAIPVPRTFRRTGTGGNIRPARHDRTGPRPDRACIRSIR